jgi:hypothetical protein
MLLIVAQQGVTAQECPLGELWPAEPEKPPTLAVSFREQWTQVLNEPEPELLHENFYCYAQA